MAIENELAVLNDALGQIGAARITAIDDGSTNANWCETFYPSLRRALLRSHHWNFAECRVELAQDAAVPAFEFAFAYTLPPKLLKVKEYNGENLDTTKTGEFPPPISRYKIEGRRLFTNDGTVKIVYIEDVTDPVIWDALFYQVLTTQLASKLAAAILKDHNKAKELMSVAVTILLPLALAVDGQEGTVKPFYVDDLLWGR